MVFFLALVKNVSRVNKDRRIEENCDILSYWKEDGSQERGRHFAECPSPTNVINSDFVATVPMQVKKIQGECIEIHNL